MDVRMHTISARILLIINADLSTVKMRFEPFLIPLKGFMIDYKGT